MQFVVPVLERLGLYDLSCGRNRVKNKNVRGASRCIQSVVPCFIEAGRTTLALHFPVAATRRVEIARLEVCSFVWRYSHVPSKQRRERLGSPVGRCPRKNRLAR